MHSLLTSDPFLLSVNGRPRNNLTRVSLRSWNLAKYIIRSLFLFDGDFSCGIEDGGFSDYGGALNHYFQAVIFRGLLTILRRVYVQQTDVFLKIFLNQVLFAPSTYQRLQKCQVWQRKKTELQWLPKRLNVPPEKSALFHRELSPSTQTPSGLNSLPFSALRIQCS